MFNAPEEPKQQPNPNTAEPKKEKVEDDISISEYQDLETLFSSIRQYTKVFK